MVRHAAVSEPEEEVDRWDSRIVSARYRARSSDCASRQRHSRPRRRPATRRRWHASTTSRLGALLGELGRLTYLESHQRAPEDANERRAALLGELEALEARLGPIAPTAAKRDARAFEARDAQGAGDANEGRQADGQTSSSVSGDAGSVPHEAYGSPPKEVD
jgi:hypothetical protein